MSNLALSEDRLPVVLPSEVARVTANGLPTKQLIDWEQLTRNWYNVNVQALDTKLTEVSSETDGNTAAITQEIQARTSADSALAQQITTVDAKVGTATANGQIYFAAAAVPAGAVAAYGIYLTAGNAFTGFEMISKSDGTAAIAISANQFTFTDSGTAQNVFNYTSGIFTFNVPVRVRTIDIEELAVTRPQSSVINSSVTVGDTGGGWVNLISHTTQADGGIYTAVVFGDFVYRGVSGGGTITGTWRLIRDRGGSISILRSGALLLFNDYFPVPSVRFVTDVRDNDVFRIQVNITVSGGSSYQFDDRSVLVDLRKR